ncbi:MAG: hypothetical protein U0V75_18170 [Ferruginibacter sp.]
MKKKFFYPTALLLLWGFVMLRAGDMHGQQYDCSNSFPVFKMNFGDESSPQELQLAYARKFYSRTKSSCPEDGEFTFVSSTGYCFSDHWYSIPRDHTPGSTRGRMMLVNAASKPSPFFSYLVTGLQDNAHYTFSAWILNVCRPGAECTDILPSVRASFSDNGKFLGSARSGAVPFGGPAGWQQFSGEFNMPAGVTSCFIILETTGDGGCGNDFAIDDIELRMCRVVVPPVQKPAPVITPVAVPANQTVAAKPVIKPAAPKPVPVQAAPVPQKNTAPVKTEPVSKPEEKSAVISPVKITAPPVILQTRNNVVAKEIETSTEELEISLYDNGDIDGDTVSIYHNNMPLLMHKGLSDKPISFKVKVSAAEPHHELVMVADNLGSIPPNTSVMIINSKTRRYEISLSSSEKQNAKVVIDLKKE